MVADLATTDVREARLQEILLAYDEAAEQGQAPLRDEWLARHREFAAELQEYLAGRDRVEPLAVPLRAIAQAITHASNCLFDTAREQRQALLPGLGRFGDYELKEEIGRGGMGVVYRAEQRDPKRVVAVKVIRAGAFASPAEVQRFRNEADIVARLEHPNIVPIYEVGEHPTADAGAPITCFSMRFVEGGSLASRLSDFRRRPRDAA